jgi:hypothetical protein
LSLSSLPLPTIKMENLKVVDPLGFTYIMIGKMFIQMNARQCVFMGDRRGNCAKRWPVVWR